MLLRMSVGPGQLPSTNNSEINEQLKLWQELEKVKRENEHMSMQLELLRIEKQTTFADKGK